MFSSFHTFTIPVSTASDTGGPVTISGLKSFPSSTVASGPSPHLPTILLLHGFPQTLHIWRHVVGPLLPHFNVVALDLRGYGGSSKPAQPVEAYAKSLMARDCVAVMDSFLSSSSSNKFYICAHDRGARVAHKLLADYPDRVLAATILDICPTLAMYENTDKAFAQAYWHWFFLIQKEPLPENMIARDGREFARLYMGGRQKGGLTIFREEQGHVTEGEVVVERDLGQAWEAYVRNLSDPETVHAMCQDYRAAATVDLDESRADLEAGRKIACPITVLWGRYGVIEKCFDALAEWRKVSRDGVEVKGGAVESGHYIPEERPEDVVKAVIAMLG